ncbi:hypothetical protein CEY12_13765 [Chryseobacterium sp. T16E-39]|uniref:hypothetical protein n=1 Tax=Chryseobacterium sp. T16E-39 TaxID=2015076 RepID=UPI000B5B2E32|nr:hypothetical protein [Chryseobacterium sp. T16E-39]ASK31108.1 hypothetical protein CEY12_13765 [Chryseobacterium sp. T16E-39]
MKKNYLMIVMSFIAGSLFYSCSSDLERDNGKTLDKSLLKRSSKDSPCDYFDSKVESSMISGVNSVYLDNGVSTTCKNNILIFPTLKSYEEAILLLDKKIEGYNDDFDQQTINMTDVEADDYAESISFDENKPLVDFERELDFCSLRQHILGLDNAWIAQQGDGMWNLDTSPDEYYIDDETERALLSLGSEFIVGDCKSGYTLYKRYDWGYVSFPITNVNTTIAVLTALNTISNPTQQPINIGGATKDQVVGGLKPFREINYTITVTNPSSSQSVSCRDGVKNKGQHLFSSERRILWKHKLKDAKFPNTSGTTLMKTFTKSFGKKKGKWKRFRATIFTGYYGKTSIPVQCTDFGNEPLTGKEKRRKKIKERSYIIGDISVKQDEFFSVHKQEGNSYQNEVY